VPDIDDVVERLEASLARPLTGDVWPGVAAASLARFGDVPLLHAFAEKALETLADLERHDRLAVSPEAPRVAIWFVAWSGTHREVQPERYGEYLTSLLSTAQRVRGQGVELAAFLQLDAYLRETGQDLEVDVELSYLPGMLLGYPDSKPNPFPPVLHVNGALCTPEQLQDLRDRAG
jgi:hypothetical protein